MAEAGDFLREDTQKFQRSCRKLLDYYYQDEEKSKTNLHLALDDLISIEHIPNVINDHTARQLYQKLPNLAPLHEEQLVVKICQVILNLRTKQQLLLDPESVHCVVEYLITAVQRCPSWCHGDILLTLNAVLYSNSSQILEFHDSLIGKDGILKQLASEAVTDEDVLSGAVFCLENLTLGLQSPNVLSEDYGNTCFEIFIRMLHFVPVAKIDASMQCKILISSLRGIQSLLLTTKIVPTEHLGCLLAAVRAHMFYGLTGQPVNIPATLYATPQIHYDMQATKGAESPVKPQAVSKEELTESAVKSSKKGKKKRGVKPEKIKPLNGAEFQDRGDSHQANGASEVSADSAFRPSWLKMSSSESDYSDTEGGHLAKMRSSFTKVRQCAFGCLHTIFRNIDKRIIFGYWSAFIPDSFGPGNAQQMQILFTAILKDPSPKCRMGASAALTALIDGTKPYLAAAEDSYEVRTAFVPFSVILGSMIKELHRTLLLALIAENFPLTLTQLIKCLSTLVSNVPYHRLQPGLLGRIVKQIRHFLNHRDPNVRVACLTCIGSVVDINPPLLEVCHIIQPAHPPLGVRMHQIEDSRQKPSSLDNGSSSIPGDSGFNSLSTVSLAESVHAGVISSGQPTSEKQTGSVASEIGGGSISEKQTGSSANQIGGGSVSEKQTGSSANQIGRGSVSEKQTGSSANQIGGGSGSEKNLGFATNQFLAPSMGEKPSSHSTSERQTPCGSYPASQNHSAQSSTSSTPALAASPGNQTPVFSDQTLQRNAKEISWVLKLCMKNIMQQTSTDGLKALSYEPIPVRLESLQVVANLTKGYFPVIRNSLTLLQELIRICLDDKDPIIKLHGTKVLDELSKVLRNDIQKPEVVGPDAVSLEKVVDFWLSELDGPLPTILQTVTSNPVRANACDCIANIGPEVFTRLPMDKRVLCLTLVLGLVSDDDKLVKSAAIRTVGVYVLYSCLREDVSFIADAANAVIMTMADSSINVRMKAAWSMANLCDALILNKESGDTEFVTDFSDMLLFKLLTTSSQSTQDSDKVKSNAVRAVGNLLRYLPERSLAKPAFVSAIDDCIKTLVKNVTSGMMKVRWNACYAIGNMFHNTLLYKDGAPWLTSVLDALSTVVRECKNSKVRINAALALSVPTDRVVFGAPQHFAALWDGLIVALSLSENITHFAEFRYKDNLTEQICMALLNMLLVVQVEDLTSLLTVLQQHGHILSAHMNKIQTGPATLVTESLLKKCQSYVEDLAGMAVSSDHQTAVRLLHDVCTVKEKVSHKELEQEDEKKPLESGFQQIYD